MFLSGSDTIKLSSASIISVMTKMRLSTKISVVVLMG